MCQEKNLSKKQYKKYTNNVYRDLAKLLDMNAKDFAKELGVAYPTVCSWFTNKQKPSPRYAKKINELWVKYSDRLKNYSFNDFLSRAHDDVNIQKMGEGLFNEVLQNLRNCYKSN